MQAMIEVLTSDFLIASGDLEIIPIPISQSVVLFRMVVKPPRGELTETMAYDSDSARFIGL